MTTETPSLTDELRAQAENLASMGHPAIARVVSDAATRIDTLESELPGLSHRCSNLAEESYRRGVDLLRLKRDLRQRAASVDFALDALRELYDTSNTLPGDQLYERWIAARREVRNLLGIDE